MIRFFDILFSFLGILLLSPIFLILYVLICLESKGGGFYSVGAKTAEIIENKTGVKPTLINPIYITGTDDKLLEQLKENHDIVITVEDGVLDGGFGEKIARFYGNSE